MKTLLTRICHGSLGAILGVKVPSVYEIAGPAAVADARVVAGGAFYLSAFRFSGKQVEGSRW